MHTLNSLMGIVMMVALLAMVGLFVMRRLMSAATRRIALANDPQDGVHLGGRFTRRADGALARNLLVKAGTDANHIAVAGANDVGLVVTQDEAEAAEDLVNCQMLTCADRTVRLITDGSGAIVYGDKLVPATGGKVKKISAAGGNYYVVGFARTAPVTADGELLEVEPYGGFLTQ